MKYYEFYVAVRKSMARVFGLLISIYEFTSFLFVYKHTCSRMAHMYKLIINVASNKTQKYDMI